MEQIKLTVKMETANMYDFLLHHSYASVGGIFGVIISGVAFLYLILNFNGLSDGQRVLLILGSLLFTVINPILLYTKAAKQVKLVPMFKEELEYVLSEDGVLVRQKEEELSTPWNEIQRVVETKKNIIIYVTRVRAFVLPKNAIGKQYNDVTCLIKTVLDKKNYKLKQR